MSYLKNIFFLFIIILIVAVIGVQVFYSPKVQNDTRSYVTLVNGEAYVNTAPLVKDEKKVLQMGDEIETRQESLAVIEWGDGSLTRLGSNTKIVVKEANVAQDESKIQIAYNLVSGKSWSKVVSFLNSDSYFKAYIDDLEAGVRGSTFEINKDEGYISVYEHILTLKNQKGFSAQLQESQSFSLFNLDIIELAKFLNEVQDKAWTQINMTLDTNYLDTLKANFKTQGVQRSERILSYIYPEYAILVRVKSAESLNTLAPDIQKLSNTQKQKIYTQVEPLYQDVYFAKSTDTDLYKTKIYYRKILLLTATQDTQKEAILRGSINDMKDILNLKNYDLLATVMDDISGSKDIVKGMNIDFGSFFDDKKIVLPYGVRQNLEGQFGTLQEIFGTDILKVPNIDVNNLGDSINKLNDLGTQTINDALDSVTDFLKK